MHRHHRSRVLLLLGLTAIAACVGETTDLQFRDDDFSGTSPEPWSVLHPDLADASIVGGRLRLRPDPWTVWYGGNEAFHQYVLIGGDFAVTSHVEVGNLLGGAAAPDWRLAGLLLRDPGEGPIDSFHAAFGTVSADLSTDMVVEYKSTVSGASVLGFQPFAGGSGDIRICRVGSSVRALYRPDGTSTWSLVDARTRADFPSTLAVGPMAYAYSSTSEFQAFFDDVDFDPLTTMDDCDAAALDEPESGESSSSSSSEGGAPPSTTTVTAEDDGDEAEADADDGGADDGGEDDGGADDGGADDGGEDDGGIATELPTPSATCPEIEDGIVTFCPASLATCRDVRVINSASATGLGPLQVHWHGTYEWPEGVLSWDWATQQVRAMTIAEGGVMVLPYADPAAPARSGPFPWWVVGDPSDALMQTDRDDDFALFDEVVACMLEAELVAEDRINTSGMSAGGIMTSHLVERRGYLASAVSWSGGLPPVHQPTVPAGPTSVMVLHGGPYDLYCGPGVYTGGSCYDFVPPSEALAADVVGAGNWAFLCDHQAGHSAAMGGEGAQFMALATFGAHPWTNYPFGTGGNWMLDHYCYDAGDPSPWE